MAPIAPPSQVAPPRVQAQLFADKLAQKTGLSVAVVSAWVNAEGAYARNGTGHFNFLNVRPSSNAGVPEGRSPGGFATFRSLDDAVTATANVLRQPNMRPILQARRGSDAQQINAIASSAWDANHYRGKGGPIGSTLRGAYNAITKGGGSLGGAIGHAAGEVGGSVVGALTPDVGGYISQATSWAEGAALRALAYIVLTVVAIALFVLGLERTLGPSPLTRGLPSGINPVTARIPF